MPCKSLILHFVTRSRYEDFPDDVIHLAKRALIDVLGNLVAALGSRASTIAHQFASSFQGPQEATIFGNKRKVPCALASFANAILASDLDADDGHRGAVGHPGAAVVPTGLAFAEKHGLSGKRFLEGVVVGYELAIRMGLIANMAHQTRFFGSGHWSSFGATAAASRLMNLTAEKCLNALGICEAHSPMASMGWIESCRVPMIKEAIGWGAFTGAASALLAGDGMTGAFTLAEDHEIVVRSLGREYEFTKIYFKEHASCRWTHAAIDGVLKLKRERSIKTEEIGQINIGTFSYATRLANRTPATTHQAQYSIPFAVSAALTHGQVGPEQMAEGKLQDREILDLAARVNLYLDPDIERRFPTFTMARVEIVFLDGSKLKVDPSPTRGDYQHPFTDEEMYEKFRRYAGTVVKDEDIAELISLVRNIEAMENIDILIDVLNGAIMNRAESHPNI